MYIDPTNGRVVWYHQPQAFAGGIINHNGKDALTAHIVNVNRDDDGKAVDVNVVIYDMFGVSYTRHHVKLIQDGAEPPADEPYVAWMPYQVKQAEKAAEAEPEKAAEPQPDPRPTAP